MIVATGSALEGFKGVAIEPDQAGYDDARVVDNARFSARPALILRPTDGGDVTRALAFARGTGQRIAVRAGGHSTAGHSAGDGAVVIDLAAMQAIDIDRAEGTAWVGAGVRAGDVTRIAYDAGLAVPFGDTGSVGAAGITLGGGIGWLVRKHGLTIDSLLAAELVTADGRQLTASPDAHPDLFWALRGGGGNFGVVTRLRYQMRTIGPVLHGTITLPATREVFRSLVPALLAAPDELTAMPSIMVAPPTMPLPDGAPGRRVVFVEVLWSGPAADGDRALATIRALGPVIDDDVAEKPYPDVYPERDADREPQAWACRSIFLDGLDDGLIDVIERHLARATAPDALAHLRVLGGAAARIPNDATAFGWRHEAAIMVIIAASTDPLEWTGLERWAGAFWSDLRPYGRGTYLNFMGDVPASATELAYPRATYARLRQVKRRFDPENVFRANHNIAPA